MEFDEQSYEKIEQFLAGELKGEALQTFKAALETDEALAEEVLLAREMNELLADSPENELRKNLQQLSNQISEDPIEKSFSDRYPYLYLLWWIPILTLAAWCYFNLGNNQSEEISPNIPHASPSIEQGGEVEQPPAKINNIEDSSEKPSPETKTDTTLQQKKGIQNFNKDRPVANIKTPKKSAPKSNSGTPEKNKEVQEYDIKPPIANVEPTNSPPSAKDADTLGQVEIKDNEDALVLHDIEPPVTVIEEAASVPPLVYDSPTMSSMMVEPDPAEAFLPIPALETLIKSNKSNNEITISMQKSMKDSITISPGEKLDFRLSGTLKLNENLDSMNFKVHLFSNNSFSYQEFNSLETYVLALRPSKGKADFLFNIKKAVLLYPGLYYYLIREENDKKIYFVEKFKVGAPQE